VYSSHTGIMLGLIDLYLEKRDQFLARNRGDGGKSGEYYWKAREVYRNAKKLLEEQHKNNGADWPLLQLGQLHLKFQEFNEAEGYFLKALEKQGESGEVRNHLGVVSIRKEDYKKAAQHFEDALKKDPDELTVWSNLAEAYLKSKLFEKAELEYRRILDVAPDHVESLIGLGEVYTAMAENGDEDLFDDAIKYFNLGSQKGRTLDGSKQLKPKELAAVLYSRGYARVRLYEAGAKKLRADEALLADALKDFDDCYRSNSDFHKAARAGEKLRKKLERFAPERFADKVGPYLLILPSLLVFGASQYAYFVLNLASLSAGYYSLLTFGSLMFTVVGLYLPRILKLKFAGIELEKSVVDQISSSGTLGIAK